MKHQVIDFRVYPLRAGDRITIADGPRRGDWEVIAVGERKLRLRCPISQREVEADPFYHWVDGPTERDWPGERHP